MHHICRHASVTVVTKTGFLPQKVVGSCCVKYVWWWWRWKCVTKDAEQRDQCMTVTDRTAPSTKIVWIVKTKNKSNVCNEVYLYHQQVVFENPETPARRCD